MNRGGQNVIDMTSKTFSSLKVIKRNGSIGRLAAWDCECPCGKIFIAVGSDIRKGKIKTCGCRKSIVSRRNWQGYKGLSKTYWRQLNQGAEQRSINFSVSAEYIWSLLEDQNFKCALSGVKILNTVKNHTASLDRVSSSIGYVEGNLQWVHKDINSLKGSVENDRFIKLCRTVADYNI